MDMTMSLQQENISLKLAHHDNLIVNETGFKVHTEYPCIGASLDGIATCSCHEIRGLEIKCPYNYQKGLVNWDKDRTFPRDRSNSIKKIHPYYYQMQLQMSLCKLAKIDFFVCSPANGGSSCLYVQIPIDNQLLQCEIFPKVLRYFQNIFLPEIMRKKLESDFENCRKFYCHCQRPSFGQMIGCNNWNCETEWFHYKCVGHKRAP